MISLTERDKKQLLALGVMVILLVFLSGNAVKSINSERKRQALRKSTALRLALAKTTPAATAATGATQPQQIMLEPTGQGLPTASGIDPFSGKQISIGVTDAQNSLRLSGIVFNAKDKNNSYAIIDNNVVKLGETIGNTKLKLEDISAEEVTVSDGTHSTKLRTW